MAGEQQDKERKYDRQLRLWGQDGQSALERTHICLLGAGPTGAEAVKNLVLPGIGRFTIVDGAKVTKRDLGNNFFVEQSSIGKSRAAEVARLLHELNSFVAAPDVLEQDPAALIEANPDFVKNYTLIIATDIAEASLLKLADSAWRHNIPLVVAQTNGLLGYLRIQQREHTIVESKPDFPSTDLRLNEPFESLQQLSDSINMSTLESGEHSHLPFPIILLKAMKFWKENHDGSGPDPNDSQMKDFFKESVLQLARKDEENFSEAYHQAHLAYSKYEIPPEVEAVLSDENARQLTAQSPKFWFLARGVRDFVNSEGHGKLPLRGGIPDMHASTTMFVELQTMYRSQAESDAKHVAAHVQRALAAVGLPATHISFDEVAHFCKNAPFLKVIRYRPLSAEFGVDNSAKGVIVDNVPILDFQTMLYGDGLWYLTWRAAWRFRGKVGRYPGENVKEHKQDLAELRAIADGLLSELGFEADALSDDFLLEFCRFGNAQIHSIAALLGGVVAQEVIKLITRQWTPMNNTFIYNGIRSSASTFEV